MAKTTKNVSKRVRITLELDSDFIGRLRTTLALRGLMNGGDVAGGQMTPLSVLGIVAMSEAMGAPPMQVALLTPPEWRANIEAIHDERRVYEDTVPVAERKQLAGPILAPRA